jgi:DNA-binding MarR family transcriptional regulator
MSEHRVSVFDRQVDVVMDAARVMNSILAQSLQALDPSVTLPQLRVLVMLSIQGPLNLAGVASGLGVHPSNATRVCARLADLGLVDRRNRENDRRNVELTLTARGRRTVATVMRRRRSAVEEILVLLPSSSRTALSETLHEFTEKAAEVSDAYAVVLEGHSMHA